jgi:hypothetical protein
VRILLDECVNAGVRKAFPGHAVKTVAETGWNSTADGLLLVLAQQQFDVFVTIDRNLEHQQNLEKFDLGFVVVRMRNNEITSYLQLFVELNSAAESVQPGRVIHVGSPEAGPKQQTSR